MEIVKNVTVKEEINPRIYQVIGKMNLLLKDIGRINVLNDSNISIYISNKIEIDQASDQTAVNLMTLDVPAGTYVITGKFTANYNNCRYYLQLDGISSSATDTKGYIAGNVTIIKTYTSAKTIPLDIWLDALSSSGETLAVAATITAIRIK